MLLLNTMKNVCLLCSKAECNFLFMGTEHAFACACSGTCRAILNLTDINLRKTVAMENLIAIILSLVKALVM